MLRVTRDNGSPMLYKTNEAGAALLEQMPAGDYIIQLAGTPTGYVPEDSVPNLKAGIRHADLFGYSEYRMAAGTARGGGIHLSADPGAEGAAYPAQHRGTGTVPFTLAGAALMAVAVLLPGRKKVK